MAPNRNQAAKGQTMATPEAQALQAIDTTALEGKSNGGRPTLFSEQLSAYICGRLANGETLTAICQTPGLPATATVYRWKRENSKFRLDYEQARVDQMEAWSDEIIEISDDSSMDTVTKRDPKGREFEAIDHENIQRSRLMVDTRKFLMGKLAPRYADKVDHKHSGEVHQRHTVELSDRERMRRLATFILEDQAAGVTIEHQPDAEPIPTVAGAAADQSASMEPASRTPADIVRGTNGQPADDQT